MHSVQTIRLQAEHVLSLFSVVHCTVQNLLTLLGKEGEMDLFIHYELVFCAIGAGTTIGAGKCKIYK